MILFLAFLYFLRFVFIIIIVLHVPLPFQVIWLISFFFRQHYLQSESNQFNTTSVICKYDQFFTTAYFDTTIYADYFFECNICDVSSVPSKCDEKSLLLEPKFYADGFVFLTYILDTASPCILFLINDFILIYHNTYYYVIDVLHQIDVFLWV